MKRLYIILISVLALMATSCAKQDTVYKEFIKDGGFIYPAKPININAERGYQRIVLSWDLPMDPSIRTAKLLWDSRTQSREFNYSDYPDGKVSAVIADLEDRSYTFEVINYDAEGNASLATEITSSPFGDSWLVSHAERSIISVKSDGTNATVRMSKATDEIIATKFRYLDNNGKTIENKAVLKADEDELVLANAQKGKYLEYQSCFCSSSGIDTVWTGNWLRSDKPISYSIDRSKATVTVTSNQICDPYVPSLILDGIKDDGNSRWYSSDNATYRGKFPKILVIDTKELGDEKMTMSGFTFYENPDPEARTLRYIRAVNIYVSDTKFNPDDTNWSKNYGDPVLQITLNTNEAVQEFFPKEEKEGRYIAIVFRTSYSTFGFIDLWEFEAFGYKKKNLN